MFGKEMSQQLDIIYRPPIQDVPKTQYAQEIRRVMERSYNTARKKP